MSEYPTIPEPVADTASLTQVTKQLKESVELLTGQRGNPDEYSVDGKIDRLDRVIENSAGTFTAAIVEAKRIFQEDGAVIAERTHSIEVELIAARAGQPNLAGRIIELEQVRVAADQAQAQRTSLIEAEISGARGGRANLGARITQVDQARVDADSALAQRASNLEAEVTNARSGQSSLSAKITQVDTARVQGDQALGQRVDNVSSTVGNHTASINTLTQSVNGQAVKWALTGTVSGQTGGLTFTGVQQIGGGAIFGLDINANVRINGSLTINGTLTNEKAADRAFTQGAGSSSGGVTASVGIVTRQGAQVLVLAHFGGLSGLYWGLGTAVGTFTIYRDGLALQQVGNNYEASGSGGSAGIAFQTTSAMAVDTPSAGYHTYQAYTSNGVGLGGVTIAVVELAK